MKVLVTFGTRPEAIKLAPVLHAAAGCPLVVRVCATGQHREMLDAVIRLFDLPVHGTEIRHISLLDRDGRVQVIVPIYRSSQMGVMTVRSETELTALKSQAQ